MKTSIYLTFGICVLALIMVGGSWLGIIPTVRIGTPDTIEYVDYFDKIGFQYSDDLAIQDISQSNEKIRIINVMPKNAKNKFDPQFIEIITYNQSEGSLEASVLDFLPNAHESDLIRVQRDDIDAYEYSQVVGVGEESLYTFFSNGEKMSVVIFRMRRFDKVNPLVLIDNSMYLSSYRQIASTFEFK